MMNPGLYYLQNPTFCASCTAVPGFPSVLDRAGTIIWLCGTRDGQDGQDPPLFPAQSIPEPPHGHHRAFAAASTY